MNSDIQPITLEVLQEKYFKGGETTVDQLFERVAGALAAVEDTEEKRKFWNAQFLNNLYNGGIGAGRIMGAAGAKIDATLINCFVQPVGDCIQGFDDEGLPGIYEALREAAETMRRGGGVGYDFSRIRPKGASVGGTGSAASGPCSYMNVFDTSCTTVESAGARRGAQMGVMRIDHPDVMEFIVAKRTVGRWNNFNVSVGVTDAFMKTLKEGGMWQLVHKAKPGKSLMNDSVFQREDGLWVYRSLPAQEMWNIIMKSTYDFAEPGILFLDNINNDNNLRYCENISATNPCVTADTWVHTSEGPRRVSELLGVSFKARIRGQDFAAPGGFFLTGNKGVFRLTTTEGFELNLTADHKVLTVKNEKETWKELKDIQVGEHIVLHDHRANDAWSGQGSQDEGYMLGVLFGDGWFNGSRAVVRFHESSDPFGTMLALKDASKAVIGSDVGWSFNLSTEKFTYDYKTVHLQKLAEQYGLYPEKEISDQIQKASSDFYLGFLRGLFDTDGCVLNNADKGVSIRLSQSNRNTMLAVQRMLARLGIVSKLYENRRPEQLRHMPDGKGGSKAYLCKAQHELVVSKMNVQRFIQVIGFADTRNSVNAASINSGFHAERFIVRAKSVEYIGNQDVYDVTVDEIHAFDANGLYVHNCGEQPLPPYGCCDLGPIILTRFVRNPFGIEGEAFFDYDGFNSAVATQVRMLDNVLEATYWPLEQQRAESNAKRRIGVGFTGLGNALTMLKLNYNSLEGRTVATIIAQNMRDTAYLASIELAKEKGSFPALNVEKYLEEGTFASRLPDEIKEAIRQHGIRNSHLLSIAPTGTVSLAFADNASNGIEPPFSWSYDRKKREGDGTWKMYAVEDHAWRLYKSLGGDVNNLPGYFINALEMSAADHLGMMTCVQPYIDTAISKTVNIPADYPFEDFQQLYLQAWEAGLKGLATYRPNATLGSILSVKEEPKAEVAAPAPVDLMRVVIEKRPTGQLEGVIDKIEYWTQEGRQRMYLVVSFIQLEDGRQRAIEFFMPVGQNNESQQWVTSSMRLLSLAARGGFLPRALEDMSKVAWDRGPVRLGTITRADGVKMPKWHDSEAAALAYAIENIIATRNGVAKDTSLDTPETTSPTDAVPTSMAGKKCPECGAHAVIKKDGCEYCTACGYIGTCG